jgi:leader peptidase (prepilin peptidase)/N-methyltransferase
MKFIIFVFGLCIGSFLNVVIYRWSKGLSIKKPLFSFCPYCGKTLKWYHNIPLLSYLILKGKCAYCKAPISIIYPLVEILTAVFLLLVYLKFKSLYGCGTFLCFSYFVVFLIPTTFIDLRIKEIPDFLSFGLILGGLIFSLINFNPLLNFGESLLSSLSGIGLLFLINEIYYQFSKRDGMGMGDFKLMGGIGAFLGYKSFYWILVLASFTGILAFLGVYFFYKFKGISKELNLKTEIPFGPFLTLASLIYLFAY